VNILTCNSLGLYPSPRGIQAQQKTAGLTSLHEFTDDRCLNLCQPNFAISNTRILSPVSRCYRRQQSNVTRVWITRGRLTVNELIDLTTIAQRPTPRNYSDEIYTRSVRYRLKQNCVLFGLFSCTKRTSFPQP